jgi:hypothetical protein
LNSELNHNYTDCTVNDDFDGYEIDEGVIEFDWTPPEKFRAKLYNLDGEGRWHDLGTGNFSIELKHGHYKMKLI